MNKIKQAIATIEESQAMTCSCGFCEADRWAYALAITALREQAEREKGCGLCPDEIDHGYPYCRWCGRKLEGQK